MITLITGAPGSGKTLYCIDKILRPVLGTTVSGTDEDGNAAVYDRRIYTNINGLLLDHELIDRDWLENIHDRKTTGAFVVFDEVQRVWPNRPNGSKKPPSVEYLETHRHDGIDIVLLTQSPQLLDPAVRALVGRHLHMRRLGSMGAAVVYEWDACSNALNYKNAFTKTPYRYSRQVFKLYKSSRAHTKQTRRLPAAVYFGVAGLLAAAYMWPQLIGRITGQQDEAAQQAEAKTVPEAQPLAAAAALPTVAPGATGEVMTKAQYIESFQPRSLLPHSAPRYDQLTQPVRVPVPAACISMSSKGCKCFTQRGTPMEVRYDMCMQIVERGIFLDFDPEPQQQAKQPPVRADDRPPQQAAGRPQSYVDFSGAVISAPLPQTAVQAVRAAAS